MLNSVNLTVRLCFWKANWLRQKNDVTKKIVMLNSTSTSSKIKLGVELDSGCLIGSSLASESVDAVSLNCSSSVSYCLGKHEQNNTNLNSRFLGGEKLYTSCGKKTLQNWKTCEHKLSSTGRPLGGIHWPMLSSNTGTLVQGTKLEAASADKRASHRSVTSRSAPPTIYECHGQHETTSLDLHCSTRKFSSQCCRITGRVNFSLNMRFPPVSIIRECNQHLCMKDTQSFDINETTSTP